AVLHTLVENAITHGVGAGDVVLRLRRSAEAGNVRLVFEAPLASGAEPPASHEGTGLRYVRARLAETYRRGWTLRSGAAGGFWRTEIVLPAAT
ncbi:MAG TPA: hypothetical protein VG777_02325, partial [Thermoanaerobaculia bacterium]|nr:hypothetical protein [Thermoanaerobaculia bacterium]